MPRHLASILKRFCIGLAATIPLLGWSQAARAQEWQFALTPYAWLAGMSGKVKAGAASGSRFDVSFGEIFDHLSFPPLMLAGEARNGRFGITADVMFMVLKSDLETRNVLFNDGSVKMSSVTASLGGYYRVLDLPAASLDAGAGARLWHFSNKVKLNPGLLAGRKETFEQTFVDPILSLRAGLRLAEGWSVTVLGDIGGFGVSSDLTWQILGTVNYQATSWMELRLGYRHMAVDRKKVDFDLTGPILGATFRF
jgi:hypothetical protein